MLGGLVGLFVIGERTSWRFTGGGADMAGHYTMVYWFSHNWTPPSADDLTVGILARNPPAPYAVAALVGHVVHSPFKGMYLVALGAVVLIWCAIAALLTTLPGPRRWIGLAALAILLALNTSAGPLRLQVHGFEIVVNFFFSQLVGQALVWWLVWFTVRRRLADRSPISTAVLIACVAVLSTFVHAVAAVELLGLVACLSAAEILARWRRGCRDLRSQAPPIVLFVATAAVIAITPGFRAQRGFSRNDGYLEVDYLSWPTSYVAVALLIVAVSIMFLLASEGRGHDRGTAALLQGLGFIGISIAVSCLAQAVLLAAGEGSPYAVKKYAFGLLTVFAVDACVLAAILVPLKSTAVLRSRLAWDLGAAIGISLIATLGVLSRPGSDYFTSTIATLERRVVAAAATEDLGTDRNDYAVGLPDADRWVDYMFTIAILRPRHEQAVYAFLIKGDDLSLPVASGRLLTAVNSRYDRIACRSASSRDSLVVVDADCWSRLIHRARERAVYPGERGRQP